MTQRSAVAIPTDHGDLQLHSNLAAALFESVRPEKQLVVLDVGRATSATVDLFNQFKCKLIFSDLYADPVMTEIDETVSRVQLVGRFQSALGLPEGCKIDICLFWDFFNYLDGTLLSAFVQALRPYVDNNTCGYGLGVLNSRSALPNYCYGLHKLNQLMQYPRVEAQLPVYPHSQRDLNAYLGYFEIEKSRLMPDGRVEYFIARANDSAPPKKAIF